MRRPANSTIGELRSARIDPHCPERAAFRQAILDQAIASNCFRLRTLIIHARYALCWTWSRSADEFGVDP